MLGDLPSQILWGTGNENVIDFEYPELLDGKRTWRRPAPGSVRARNAAGVTDAAVYGYDYLLAGRARWFDAESYSNPVGLQAFIDWAGRGNQFRFVPDKNAPDFYVDGVTLDAPFEDPAPDLEEANGSQAIDLVLRNPTVDFGQAMRGIMFEYAPGMSLVDPVAATFARATAATRRGLPGTLVSPLGASDASGVLRDRNYEGNVRAALVESGARTQLVTDPENFGNWTLSNTPTRTGGQADPFGGASAYLLSDDDAATWEALQQTVTFTGDGTKSIALFIRKGTSLLQGFGLLDTTAGVWRPLMKATWNSDGTLSSVAVTAGSGTVLATENWGAGWYRVLVQCPGVIAANTNQFFVSGADHVSSGTGDGYVFGSNAWNAAFPSSYQGPSSTTRNADILSWTYAHKPQALFVLVDLIERGSNLYSGSNSGYVSVGDSTNPAFFIFPTSAVNYGFNHRRSADVSSEVVLAPALGDRIQLLGTLLSTGAVQLKGAKNGGAEVAGSVSGANALADAWSAQALLVGRRFTGDAQGFAAFARVKVGPLTFAGVTRDTIAKALVA